MLGYVYLIFSFILTISSFYMIQHRHTTLMRASGMVLAYIAAAIALKAYYLLVG